MKLSLSQMPTSGRDLDFSEDATLLNDAGEGVKARDGIRVQARAERQSGGLSVQGAVVTCVVLTCRRCLVDFDFPVDARFDVVYAPIIDETEEVELAGRDVVVGHLDGDTVDLTELVHEQVLLALPLAPVCGEGCKGLCRTCGADLNRAACGCAPEPADPRFAALKKIL